MWWQFALKNVGFGLAAGLLVGSAAALVLPGESGLGTSGVPAHRRALYGLGVAGVAYGIAILAPHGNGLISVYVAAITLGIRRPDVRRYFERQAATLVEPVKLGTFVVFGSLLTLDGLFGSGWAGVAVMVIALLVARPAAVFAAGSKIFDLTALTVFCSVLAHGATDTAGAEWVAQRSERTGERVEAALAVEP